MQFNVFKEFEFTVEVINDPPEFVGFDKNLPDTQVYQRGVVDYTLPNPTD